ncbi:MAG TPA: hydrogenase maturation protease [Chloroflexota bacterium]|nr:hydrogenase maturation protease [Chloroflexota bacterium]
MGKVLIAGVGNLLRRDDGFGVQVARRLAGRADHSGDAKVIEIGIGGIHMVQELMDGYDALVVIDVVDRGSAPGTVHILELEVPDLSSWPADMRRDFLADMHYATPSKALILAKALAVLPARVFLVGCQAADTEELVVGLSTPVARAVRKAMVAAESILGHLRDGTAVGAMLESPRSTPP